MFVELSKNLLLNLYEVVAIYPHIEDKFTRTVLLKNGKEIGLTEEDYAVIMHYLKVWIGPDDPVSVENKTVSEVFDKLAVDGNTYGTTKFA